MERKYAFLVSVIGGLFILLVLAWSFLAKDSSWGISRIFYTPFDGETPALTPPLGVMIENELAARPFQTGLSKAAVVYEAPAEGGITRFLAIFTAGEYPKKMGPVRSARPYFLDWMHEYGGAYVHVGGSDEALRRIRKESMRDIDQFTYENYFSRENIGRVAFEHTVFTTGERMKKLIEENGWNEMGDERWKIKNERWKIRNEGKNATEILIDFGFPPYQVSYAYDAQRKMYARSQIKKPHLDQGNGNQLLAKTVIVQRVKSWSLGDAAFRIAIKTVDSGDAFIFHEGRAILGTWEKESLKARTKFFDSEGREIGMDGQPVWIEILPLANSFSFS